jgi:bacterioferritin-associated ferredoxin
MSTVAPRKSAVICHCLQITETQVRDSIDSGRIASVKDVMECTGAGSGCTACHRQILAMLRQKCRIGSAYAAPSTCVDR